jgi:HAD superfamily hydrolase (TIGR01459 family)
MTRPSLSAAPALSLLPGFGAVSSRYPVLLCDVWGVVHDGVRAFPEACSALQRHRAQGGVVILITNAPRPSGPLHALLKQYGAPRDCYDSIVSSGDVTVELMAARGAAPVYFIGPERDLTLFPELAEAGAQVPPQAGLDAARYAVISGMRDDEVETPADYEAELRAMRAHGLEAICANPDIVVHRGEKLIYCGGALAARYEEIGGRVIYAGKPHAPIYERALAAARAAQRARGLAEGGATLCLGDAIRTDLAGAVAQGHACLFVADGIHRDAYTGADGALDPRRLDAAFGEGARPTYVMKRLAW